MRLALLMVVFLPFAALAQETPRQIVVSATGLVDAAPDMATVTLGVSREARTASQAMSAVGEAGGAVLENIRMSGIEDRDVQTSSLNLNPVWDRGGNDRPPQVRGYVASTMLTVRVRDLDSLGGLLDALVGEGANTLNGLEFGIADPDPLEAEARADAVERARAKADTLAQAAGVKLGPVRTISEGGGGPDMPVPLARTAMMEAAAVPIAAGEVGIRVSVTVEFDIAD